MTSSTGRRATAGEIARIRGLAQAGFYATEIAAIVGLTVATVTRQAGGLAPRSGSVRNEVTRARHREIAIAYDSAPRGQRGALLAQFGVSSMGALKVLACHGRRVLKQERAAPSDAAATVPEVGPSAALDDLQYAVWTAMRRARAVQRKPAAASRRCGRPPMGEVRARRIVSAAEHGDMPHADLARRFGYASAQTFGAALNRCRRRIASEARA